MKTFGAMTADLLRMREWLRAEGCTHVGMESTGSTGCGVYDARRILRARRWQRVLRDRWDWDPCGLPSWCLHAGAVERAPLQVDADAIVVVVEHLGDEDVEDTGLGPLLEAAMKRRAAAKLLRIASTWSPSSAHATARPRPRPDVLPNLVGTSSSLASMASKDHAQAAQQLFDSFREPLLVQA